MEKTRVISIEWPPNCGKSTLISNIKDSYNDLNILFYPETAREVMNDYPWSELNQDMFQEIIYHREAERIYKLKQDVQLWIYDAIIIDRTSMSWWIFSVFNQDKWVIEFLMPALNFPSIYDNVIFFEKPIGDYKWNVEAFVWYNNNDLNDLFKRYIPSCYKKCVTYNNYLENMEEVDQYIYKLLREEWRSLQRWSVMLPQNGDEKDQNQ